MKGYFFSDLKNEYNLLGTKSKQIANSLKNRKMSFSLTPSKKYTIIEEFSAKKFENHIR